MGKLRSRAHPLPMPLHELMLCFLDQNMPPPGPETDRAVSVSGSRFQERHDLCSTSGA